MKMKRVGEPEVTKVRTSPSWNECLFSHSGYVSSLAA